LTLQECTQGILLQSYNFFYFVDSVKKKNRQYSDAVLANKQGLVQQKSISEVESFGAFKTLVLKQNKL
jgi:hypothetical protein